MSYLIFVIACFLQPICWPLPEMSTVLIGEELFGSNVAFFTAYIFILLGIVFMYKVTFFLSNKYLKKFKASKNYKKYQKFILNNELLTTGVLFILPILPDEVICIGSAIMGIKFKVFFSVALVAKAISIGLVAYSGFISGVLNTNQAVIIIFELGFVFIASFVYNKFKQEKNCN